MTKNPYFTVWFRTKKTIDNILTKQVKFRYQISILLAIISSFLGSFEDIIAVFDELIYIMVPSAIFIVLGYLGLSRLLPWLISTVGRIWNGRSNIHELRVIIGLAQVPVCVALIEQFAFLLLGELKAYWEVNIVIQWIVWIFYTRILIIGIARTQGFSYGIALLNLVISVLPFFVLRLMFL